MLKKISRVFLSSFLYFIYYISHALGVFIELCIYIDNFHSSLLSHLLMHINIFSIRSPRRLLIPLIRLISTRGTRYS